MPGTRFEWHPGKDGKNQSRHGVSLAGAEPEDLILRDERVKITIVFSTRSVEFFKRQAEKHATRYQRMIGRSPDAYAQHHSQTPTAKSARTSQPAGGAPLISGIGLHRLCTSSGPAKQG